MWTQIKIPSRAPWKEIPTENVEEFNPVKACEIPESFHRKGDVF